MGDEQYAMSRTQQARPVAEVTDTIKMQVGVNTSDISYLKNKVGDLNVVTNRMDLMTKDIQEIRIDLDEANKSIDGKIDTIRNEIKEDFEALEEKVDGIKDYLKVEIKDVAKGITRFRYWLFGTIVTCTIFTLGFWNSKETRFQDDIRKQIVKLELQVKADKKETHKKIDSNGKESRDNFTVLIKMIKK